MSEGKSFHIHAPARGKVRRPTVRKSDGRNRQTIGGGGPKSLLRWDVNGHTDIQPNFKIK